MHELTVIIKYGHYCSFLSDKDGNKIGKKGKSYQELFLLLFQYGVIYDLNLYAGLLIGERECVHSNKSNVIRRI